MADPIIDCEDVLGLAPFDTDLLDVLTDMAAAVAWLPDGDDSDGSSRGFRGVDGLVEFVGTALAAIASDVDWQILPATDVDHAVEVVIGGDGDPVVVSLCSECHQVLAVASLLARAVTDWLDPSLPADDALAASVAGTLNVLEAAGEWRLAEIWASVCARVGGALTCGTT